MTTPTRRPRAETARLGKEIYERDIAEGQVIEGVVNSQTAAE